MPTLFDLLKIFDLQTATMLLSLAMLVQAFSFFLQFVLVREYQGIRTVSMAYLGIAIGIFLATLRGFLPAFLSIILSNYFLAIGVALYYVGISRFVSEKYNRMLVTAALAPVIILFPYFTYGNDNITARIVLIGFSGALLYGGIAFPLLRMRRTAYRFTANLLGVSFIIQSLAMVFRTVGLALYPVRDVFEPNGFLSVISMVVFATTFLSAQIFLLMIGQRLQSDLGELARVDSLTSVLNRRAMAQLLDAEFSRRMRTRMDFSILLIDLDHFKSINDSYGHKAGDLVLHEVAQRMRGSLRAQDFISRWGGEEFLVLLPVTGPREALEIGERLRIVIGGGQFSVGDDFISVTASIGMAHSNYCDNLEKIYKYADVALYKAKLTRNSVV
ncbi:MAG: GGDEF domain-containing protein [Chloroflexota bacterium]